MHSSHSATHCSHDGRNLRIPHCEEDHERVSERQMADQRDDKLKELPDACGATDVRFGSTNAGRRGCPGLTNVGELRVRGL